MLTYSRVNIIALVKSMPVNHIKAAVIAPSSILILYVIQLMKDKRKEKLYKVYR